MTLRSTSDGLIIDFVGDQMKVIVQSKWSNLNQFSWSVFRYDECIRLFCVGSRQSVGAVCFQRHFSVFFSLFTLFVIGTFLLLCLSEVHCFSAQANSITETNWQTDCGKKLFQVLFFFPFFHSLSSNNARGRKIVGMLWFCFLLRLFYAFHIRLVKNIIRPFFSLLFSS